MKTVDKLDKKKYRRDLWLDNEGVLWFWDAELNDWAVLEPVATAAWNIGEGYEVTQTLGTMDDDYWPDGPFIRIAKGPRE